MANQLLSVAGLVREDQARAAAKKEQEMNDEVEQVERCWLYHADCPEGQIFEGPQDIDAAIDDGWVESPDDIEDAPEPVKPPPGKVTPAGQKAAESSTEKPDASATDKAEKQEVEEKQGAKPPSNEKSSTGGNTKGKK